MSISGLINDASPSSRLRSSGRVSFWRILGVPFVAVMVVLAASGCGRKAAAPPVPPPVATDATPAPTVPPGPLPVSQPPVVLTQPDGQVDLPELQRSVLRWVLANRRRPSNFEEFAATAGIQIPPAPAGQKYKLAKDLHVQLVNR